MRICEAKLKVFIRTPDNLKVAIKATITGIHRHNDTEVLLLTQISPKGKKLLKAQSKIKVEFIMMSTKVVFTTFILNQSAESVMVSLPPSLVSLERRKNMRYTVVPEVTAYLKLSRYVHPKIADASRPSFPFYQGLDQLLHVGDVSLGGLSIISYYPDVNAYIENGFIDPKAQLFLPMRKPIEFGFEIRWCKKLTEHVHKAEEPADHRTVKIWKYGAEFVERYHTDQVKLAIQQYIQQITQAEAI